MFVSRVIAYGPSFIPNLSRVEILESAKYFVLERLWPFEKLLSQEDNADLITLGDWSRDWTDGAESVILVLGPRDKLFSRKSEFVKEQSFRDFREALRRSNTLKEVLREVVTLVLNRSNILRKERRKLLLLSRTGMLKFYFVKLCFGNWIKAERTLL